VAESGFRFLLGHDDGIGQVGLGTHDAHAATAAAAGRFDDDRVTDLTGDTDVLVGVVAQRATRAGHARHAGGLHGADRFDLVAHQADDVGGGPDEDETGFPDLFREVRVFGGKPVAEADRLGVGD